MKNEMLVKPMPQQGMNFEAIKDHLSKLEMPEPYAHFPRAFRGPKDVQEVIAMGVSLLNLAENSTCLNFFYDQLLVKEPGGGTHPLASGPVLLARVWPCQ